MALVPELATAEAEPEADAAALTALVDWCVRFSPAVAADAPDGLFLDITGVAHLWGGEARDAGRLPRPAGRPTACRSAAPSPTPRARPGRWPTSARTATIAPPGGQAALLAPLPPAALRLEPETAAQIERLGLRQRRPADRRSAARRRSPAASARAALTRLDQALGRGARGADLPPPARRPGSPAWPSPSRSARRRTWPASPPTSPPSSARGWRREGQGARRFELAFHRLDGKALPLAVGLSLPGRDAGAHRQAVRARSWRPSTPASASRW